MQTNSAICREPFAARLCVLAAVSLLPAGVAAGQQLRLLDPMAIPLHGDASAAVITVQQPAEPVRKSCDLVVIGGGMGGAAAAMTAARQGLRVCITEPTKWLGGQATSQGVSALDENRWIETTGATRTYQGMRLLIRQAYEAKTITASASTHLNPGACWVSKLCFEPLVGVQVLDRMLAQSVKAGRLDVMLRTAPAEVERDEATIRSVLVYGFENRSFTRLEGRVFVDATELGDLLPLAGVSFRSGAEARSETGEPDAPETANPKALQSFTYPFVLARGEGPGIPIEKPAIYDETRGQYSLTIHYGPGNDIPYAMYEKKGRAPGAFWTYRRLVAQSLFQPGTFSSDLAMINWPGNDACAPDYLSDDPLAAAKALQYGKQVGAGFAWWLKHDAPRNDGSGAKGFPELVLRGDVLGTADGLSMYPYIRESRRIAALETVREQDLAEPWQKGARARQYDDTAGIGYYPIDIHGCGESRPLPKSKPYQIPFGALISRQVGNLLVASKNIGVTHITNGAYRLHPTEWAIGEAVGILSVAAVRQKRQPAEVRRDPAGLRKVQKDLLDIGHPLVWFDDVTLDDPAFVAVQWAALEGRMPPDPNSLHFRPEDTVTGDEAAAALGKEAPAGLASRRSVRWADLGVSGKSGKIARREFAQWLSQN